jgi:putative FmdB family regulatory protein
MPTYDYRCKTCEAQFELTQSFKDKTLTRCPKSNGPEACVSPGKGEVAKVFAAPGITFKGSGFYKNDAVSPASKSSSDKETSSEKSSSSSDTKTSSTSDKKSDTKKDSSKVSTSSGSSSGSSDS